MTYRATLANIVSQQIGSMSNAPITFNPGVFFFYYTPGPFHVFSVVCSYRCKHFSAILVYYGKHLRCNVHWRVALDVSYNATVKENALWRMNHEIYDGVIIYGCPTVTAKTQYICVINLRLHNIFNATVDVIQQFSSENCFMRHIIRGSKELEQSPKIFVVHYPTKTPGSIFPVKSIQNVLIWDKRKSLN